MERDLAVSQANGAAGGETEIRATASGGARRRPTTIRTRLIVSFVLAVLLVAVAISVTSGLAGLRSARQQAFGLLDLATALKRREVRVWVDDLQLDLSVIITERSERERASVVLTQSQAPEFRQVAQDALRSHFQSVIEQTGRFEQLALLDADGRVVVSTEQGQQGSSLAGEVYFQRGLTVEYVQPPTFSGAQGRVVTYASRPLYDADGRLIGVLAGRANLTHLSDIMSQRIGMGETGETYAVAGDRRLLTDLRTDYPGTHLDTQAVRTMQTGRLSGRAVYDNYWGVPVLGVYSWMPELEIGLLGEIEVAEAMRGARLTFLLNGGVALVALALAVGLALYVAHSIATPLGALSDTASRIAAGDLALVARVERDDEIGTLARAFNAMTGQLRELIDSLEERVIQRTRGLQAAAQVSRVTTSVLDPEILQRNVVDLVRERFDLYYVGLFQVDEKGEYAVLRAGTGEPGRQMLDQGHRLAVGGASMIGQCTGSDRVMVQLHEDEERYRYANPLLPETRSELALPLRARGRVIGAMTVQSERDEAFDETTIAVLQTLADQVAVSMDNARLFAETQEALSEAEAVHRRYLGQAWQQYIRDTSLPGYLYMRDAAAWDASLQELDQDPHPLAQAVANEGKLLVRDGPVVPHDGWTSPGSPEKPVSSVLVAPVSQGGRIVAALGFERDSGSWSPEQIALVKAVAEQLGLAVDNQRLLDATQTRAARDRIVTEVAECLSTTLDLDAVLKTAVREIGDRLGLDRVSLQVNAAAKTDGRGRADRSETS